MKPMLIVILFFAYSCSSTYQSKNSTWVGHNINEARNSLGIKRIKKIDLENGNIRYVTQNRLGVKEFLTNKNGVIISYIKELQDGTIIRVTQ